MRLASESNCSEFGRRAKSHRPHALRELPAQFSSRWESYRPETLRAPMPISQSAAAFRRSVLASPPVATSTRKTSTSTENLSSVGSINCSASPFQSLKRSGSDDSPSRQIGRLHMPSPTFALLAEDRDPVRLRAALITPGSQLE